MVSWLPIHAIAGHNRVRNHLRVLRAERKWSQAELANRLNVSRQAVNAIETGKHDPSLPLAFRIAKLFNRPIEDIFTDDAKASEVLPPT
jgi:putative transcriptional regulator